MYGRSSVRWWLGVSADECCEVANGRIRGSRKCFNERLFSSRSSVVKAELFFRSNSVRSATTRIGHTESPWFRYLFKFHFVNSNICKPFQDTRREWNVARLEWSVTRVTGLCTSVSVRGRERIVEWWTNLKSTLLEAGSCNSFFQCGSLCWRGSATWSCVGIARGKELSETTVRKSGWPLVQVTESLKHNNLFTERIWISRINKYFWSRFKLFFWDLFIGNPEMEMLEYAVHAPGGIGMFCGI